MTKVWKDYEKEPCENCVYSEGSEACIQYCPYDASAARCDFEIGDEVRRIGSEPEDDERGWVIRNANEQVKTMYVLWNDGSAGEENKSEWYRTGRHNHILAEAIKALPFINPE